MVQEQTFRSNIYIAVDLLVFLVLHQLKKIIYVHKVELIVKLFRCCKPAGSVRAALLKPMTFSLLSCFYGSSLHLMFLYFYVFPSRNQSNQGTNKIERAEIPVVQEASVSPHHSQFYSFSWSRNS